MVLVTINFYFYYRWRIEPNSILRVDCTKSCFLMFMLTCQETNRLKSWYIYADKVFGWILLIWNNNDIHIIKIKLIREIQKNDFSFLILLNYSFIYLIRISKIVTCFFFLKKKKGYYWYQILTKLMCLIST